MGKLTHVDSAGKAKMVDVGQKGISQRIAVAEGHISLAPSTVDLINQNQLKKGDVLTVAQIAGITAAKATSSLIPLCHNIVLDSVKVDAMTDITGVTVRSEVACSGKTGVEMEALTAVSVALLTIYDMCKAVDKEMRIDSVQLIKKEKHEIT
ncbi:MAG: cyclic pyranopterin monophosphate synthase MoaC [Bacteroidales bacterium]|nr:cyclic pyranopterin monophosphate synthase MoaC [Bacteroidales bacterium]